MPVSTFRIGVTGLFFLFIFVTGYWLAHLGKPFNPVLFTVHKLIALGAVVYLIVTAVKMNQALPLGPAQIAALVVVVLLIIATMATGAVISLEKPAPQIVARLHQVTPYLALAATGVALYL